MVNKIKRFFRSMGKPAGSSAAISSNGAYPVLASSDNQFHHLHELQQQRSSSNNSSFDNGMPVMMARSATESSGSGSDSTPTSLRNGGGDGVRWSLLLPRIPRLVAEATASATSTGSNSSSGASGDDDNDDAAMTTLLEMLTQMAPKDAQMQIRQFYVGNSSSSSSSATGAAHNSSSNASPSMIAGWEQRKVFRQCRRALLLCWKFIIAQLNDEHARVTGDRKATYYKLIGLIAERVEFNLHSDTGPSASPSVTSKSVSSRPQTAPTGQMMGWTVDSPTATKTPVATSIDPPLDIATSTATSTSPTTAAISDESVDGERDLYLYRCLLVATFKFVVENIEAANAHRRSWITVAELRFFAKVFAICFFRVPVLQRMMLDQVYATYKAKQWVNTVTAPSTSETTPPDDASSSSTGSANGSGRTTPPATPDSRAYSRRRSSSRLGSGVTFTGSLSRWSAFENHVLSETTSDSDVASSATTTSAPAPAESSNTPSCQAADAFKRANSALFRWSRYAPYLAPYADTDVFRMHDEMRTHWLEQLSHDGEFYGLFMRYYSQHADVSSVGEPVWSALPGYPLLVRVALLLLKEASWSKWLFIRDNTVAAGPSALYDSPSSTSATPRKREPFELRSIRGIRSVLDSAAHWLRNRELLESCTLAMMECTNVMHPRSVSAYLVRCDGWFSAAAVLVPDANDPEQLVSRLPSTFAGQTFALGLRLMLASESFETLMRVLQFLYQRLEIFDGELRTHVLKVLVQRHMSLFLHWHADVRSAYHHVLVYKVIRVNRYFLDSPIDHLLLGRDAVLSQLETSGHTSSRSGRAHNGFDDFDDHIGSGDAPYPIAQMRNSSVDSNFSGSPSGGQLLELSAAEFSALRTEQALWRAFDACIGAICVHERRNAKEGNRRYQHELQCARSRAVAFQKLNRKTADDPSSSSSSSMNEGLPGGKPWLELDLLDVELHREPPYYLRYLPAEEVSSIDELRRLASTLRYPTELQVYAAASLRHYSDLLKTYYETLSRNRCVVAPPLGFP